MNNQSIPFFLTVLSLAIPAGGNEALDILEGNKTVEEVDLPPLPADQSVADGTRLEFVEPEWVPSPLDPVWSRAVLFEDETNPWIQQIAVMGLFQWGGSWGSADIETAPDVNLDTTRTRRARLGARLKIFGNTEIETVGEFAGNSRYQRLETFKGKTKVLPNHYVEYGKFRPRFGIEGSKYSRDPASLLTPETTLLTNMLMPASTLGVSIGQDCAPWDWSIGWFSNDTDRYFPGFRGSGMIVGNLAYEAGERLSDDSVMRTRWHLDYIFNLDGDGSRSVPRYLPMGRIGANGTATMAMNPAFRHLVSTGVSLESERFAMESDFQMAHGDTRVWGLTVTPSYWLVPGSLRLVGRYHYADTDDAGGLYGNFGLGADPFYDDSPLFAGDELHSFYLGANLHLYQDKCVILNGLEYVMLEDDANGNNTASWIWHSGARVSF